jgi:hypothetical protein
LVTVFIIKYLSCRRFKDPFGCINYFLKIFQAMSQQKKINERRLKWTLMTQKNGRHVRKAKESGNVCVRAIEILSTYVCTSGMHLCVQDFYGAGTHRKKVLLGNFFCSNSFRHSLQFNSSLSCGIKLSGVQKVDWKFWSSKSKKVWDDKYAQGTIFCWVVKDALSTFKYLMNI